MVNKIATTLERWGWILNQHDGIRTYFTKGSFVLEICQQYRQISIIISRDYYQDDSPSRWNSQFKIDKIFKPEHLDIQIKESIMSILHR